MQLAKGCSQTICFALLDADSLQQINDRYGHEVGDRVLYHLGKLLQKNFPSEELLKGGRPSESIYDKGSAKRPRSGRRSLIVIRKQYEI